MEFTLNKETMEFEPVKQPFKVVEIRCETEKKTTTILRRS